MSVASPGFEERFEFGKNWNRFRTVIDDGRLQQAEVSLISRLGSDNLVDRRFLDIGSGSGLFSLAARRLGAEVVSFDYDALSVSCTNALRERHFSNDSDWRVEQGSVLSKEYLSSLGTFDIVYSWGVLHHTGAMWQAMANVAPLVRPGGLLYIAVYNDQGSTSVRWKSVKRTYVRSNLMTRIALLGLSAGWLILDKIFRVGRRSAPPKGVTVTERGMSRFYDLIDWVGGYPFEVAKPEDVIDFYRRHGFACRETVLVGAALGCNEFVFEKLPSPSGP
jgi:2-polyprenyl-3-methyl-5-hydroxy-6-metoxy-1,4-benzoquinol methylase